MHVLGVGRFRGLDVWLFLLLTCGAYLSLTSLFRGCWKFYNKQRVQLALMELRI